MADPIREALGRLQEYAAAHPEHNTGELVAAALAALAAEPPAPAEPDTDGVLALAAIIRRVDGSHSLGAAALAEAILAHPNAASVFQPPAPAPAADEGECTWIGRDGQSISEREWLADWVENEARFEYGSDNFARAAALLRQPAPAPVPVPGADRPWKRPGWRDAEGRCWWFNRVGIPEWQLADGGPYGDFCLPHWAIPVPKPPQGGEVEQ